MSRFVSVVTGLILVSLMWSASYIAVRWSISQMYFLHLLGVLMLGGGSIVISVMFTMKTWKKTYRKFFPV